MAKKKAKTKSKGKGIDLAAVDFKGFFLKHGEQVALWSAVAIMSLMLFVGLMLNGFRAGSAQKTADGLRAMAKGVRDELSQADPKPDTGNLPEAVARAADIRQLDAGPLALVSPFFDAASPEDLKWRQPQILAPDEFDAHVVRVQVPSFLFSSDMQMIYIRKPKDTKVQFDTAGLKGFQARYGKHETGSQSVREQYIALMKSRRAAALGGVPPSPSSMDRLRLDIRQDTTPQFELIPFDIDKVGSVGEPAHYVRPYVMAIISGSFPYKKQMDNFRKALHYSTVDEMLNDRVKDPAVEFTGINVERRTLSLDGQEQRGWEAIDIATPYKQMHYMAVGKQPEDPEWVKYGLIVTRIPAKKLVNTLPRSATLAAATLPGQAAAPGAADTAKEDSYPEPKLPELAAALETAKKKGLEAVAAGPAIKPRFDLGTYDPDREDNALTPSGAAAGGQPGTATAPAAGPQDEETEGGRRGSSRGSAQTSGGARTAHEVQLPDHCLFRFLDLTVKAGHLYEYRVQIKMANPNYRKPQLAVSEKLTSGRELTGDWVEVDAKAPDGKAMPLRIRIPDDSQFYAVDDKPDEVTRQISVVSPWDNVSSTNQRTPVQIHRWVASALINPNEPTTSIDLGEWSVVQRTLVYRGDFIGGVRDTVIPWFDPKAKDFVLVDQKGSRSRPGSISGKRGLPIDFNTHCVLIDFEGGSRQTYSDGGKTMTYDTPVQLLVLNPEGKLVVRDEEKDTLNQERIDRVEAWRKRIQTVLGKFTKIKEPQGQRGQRGGGGGGPGP